MILSVWCKIKESSASHAVSSLLVKVLKVGGPKCCKAGLVEFNCVLAQLMRSLNPQVSGMASMKDKSEEESWL
jgi:hypothetical protein